MRLRQISFSPSALGALSVYQWPGNVRELQNRIPRALATTMDTIITSVALGLEELPIDDKELKLSTIKEARDTAEKNAVHRALALCGNNISQAAKMLEISRPTLHDLLKKNDINTT